jgi:nicotinamidase-related amidase/ureidoglycolate hydrolase
MKYGKMELVNHWMNTLLDGKIIILTASSCQSLHLWRVAFFLQVDKTCRSEQSHTTNVPMTQQKENNHTQQNNNGGDDHYIELVLATKENTKNVGWLITDESNYINENEIGIPFYDSVTEGGNLDFADWKDQPCVRSAKIRWRDDTKIAWMERHMEMTQGFFLIGKSPGLFVLGEPTHDRQDLTEEERRSPDLSRMKGFIIPGGCGIIIKKGTWHDFPVSVGPDLSVFIINTREVVDALASMDEPAPMDFGDCFKIRCSDVNRNVSLRFPDPRPFVRSLCLLDEISPSSPPALPLRDTDTDDSFYGEYMERVEVNPWGGPARNNVWVVPIINVESFNSGVFGPSVQPHLNQSHPEIANSGCSGWRNYGNKRGLQRLAKMFNQHNIRCTAVVSSDLTAKKEVMSVLQQLEEHNKWEIGAHGANNSNAGHVGLSYEEECNSITMSLDRLSSAFKDNRPKTWLTPGFSVTSATPRCLVESGVETLLDFVDDDVPFELRRKNAQAGSLICLPYSMETNDFSLVLSRNLSPREYAAALESHILQMAKESRESGTPTVVCIGMHTFVAGTPASSNELDKMLRRLQSNQNISWATAREVTEAIRKGDSDDLSFDDEPPPAAAMPIMQLSVSASPSPKMAILAIDFQNDFLSPGGFGEALGNDPLKLRQIIEPTRNLLDFARSMGIPVIHTCEGHRSNLADLTSLKASKCVIQSIRGEWGNEIIPELKPRENETIIHKPGKGAFYATDLELVLNNLSVDTLLVCGVTTEICVHSTVREANDRGYRCIVMRDCTASYFDDFHSVGLAMIEAQGGILGTVTDSKSWMDEIYCNDIN